MLESLPRWNGHAIPAVGSAQVRAGREGEKKMETGCGARASVRRAGPGRWFSSTLPSWLGPFEASLFVRSGACSALPSWLGPARAGPIQFGAACRGVVVEGLDGPFGSFHGNEPLCVKGCGARRGGGAARLGRLRRVARGRAMSGASIADGQRHARDIDYRHLVAALKRKPGAFEIGRAHV